QAHFDYIASAPMYSRLVQGELMRTAGRVALSPAARGAVERHIKPIYIKLNNLIREGIECGEFRNVDPGQTLTSILGVIIFYFISLPVQQALRPGDATSPERLAARREAILDFVSSAVLMPSRGEKGKSK